LIPLLTLLKSRWTVPLKLNVVDDGKTVSIKAGISVVLGFLNLNIYPFSCSRLGRISAVCLTTPDHVTTFQAKLFNMVISSLAKKPLM
jgi:hypothetical protein